MRITVCQQTSPKRWFEKMNVTSNCDVTISAHQTQLTTICHWMKSLHENYLRMPLLTVVMIRSYFATN